MQTQAPSPSLVRSHTRSSSHHTIKRTTLVKSCRHRDQGDRGGTRTREGVFVTGTETEPRTIMMMTPFPSRCFAPCLPRRCRNATRARLQYKELRNQGIEDVSQRRCQESTISKHTRVESKFVAQHFYPPSRLFRRR
jgi:hypothetical protein